MATESTSSYEGPFLSAILEQAVAKDNAGDLQAAKNLYLKGIREIEQSKAFWNAPYRTPNEKRIVEDDYARSRSQKQPTSRFLNEKLFIYTQRQKAISLALRDANKMKDLDQSRIDIPDEEMVDPSKVRFPLDFQFKKYLDGAAKAAARSAADFEKVQSGAFAQNETSKQVLIDYDSYWRHQVQVLKYPRARHRAWKENGGIFYSDIVLPTQVIQPDEERKVFIDQVVREVLQKGDELEQQQYELQLSNPSDEEIFRLMQETGIEDDEVLVARYNFLSRAQERGQTRLEHGQQYYWYYRHQCQLAKYAKARRIAQEFHREAAKDNPFSVEFLLLKDGDIDEMLDEIEEEEEKFNAAAKAKQSGKEVDWSKIVQKIKDKNANYIKNLVTSKEMDIDAQNPADGKTLLIYAVIVGDVELITALCNFGCDAKIRDHEKKAALDYALKYGIYEISELVYFRLLSGGLGNDLKHITKEIRLRREEAENMLKCDRKLCDLLVKYVARAIGDRAPIDENLLFYAWYFTEQEAKQCAARAARGGITDRYEEARIKRMANPLQHELWTTMMSTYEAILANTSDKHGWEWLKARFVTSYIWFLPHPRDPYTKEVKQQQANENKMENVLKKTLFHELLYRVRAESKRQSDRLLKAKIDAIKAEKPEDWKQLISYNVVSEHSKNARQDVCGCLAPRYSQSDLSEAKYPPSTHFSAKKHYDTNMYLNELLFVANVMDSAFQFAMKQVTKEINEMTGSDVHYKAGPVKTLTRSQAKVENDYINEAWPTSAKILDINRCAIEFLSIADLMKYLELFVSKIEKKEAGCITKVIRCKNGWSEYKEAYPQYTDVKLNVLVQTPDGNQIIAEIQFLLDLMSAFKKKAHKLYAVERKFEMVFNFALLAKTMSTFKQFNNMNEVLRDLVLLDRLSGFQEIWLHNNPDYELLVDTKPQSLITNNHAFQMLASAPNLQHSQIYDYLSCNFRAVLAQSVIFSFLAYSIRKYRNSKYGNRSWAVFAEIFNQKHGVRFQHVKDYDMGTKELHEMCILRRLFMLRIMDITSAAPQQFNWNEHWKHTDELEQETRDSLMALNLHNDEMRYLQPRNVFNYDLLAAPQHGHAYNATEFKFELVSAKRTAYAFTDKLGGKLVEPYQERLSIMRAVCNEAYFDISVTADGVAGIQKGLQLQKPTRHTFADAGKIVDVALAAKGWDAGKGCKHLALLLNEDGNVFGIAPHESEKDKYECTLVAGNCVQIAMGSTFYCAVRKDGGLALNGKLGESQKPSYEFLRNGVPGTALQAACSEHAVLVLMADGRLAVCGWSGDCGLGLGASEVNKFVTELSIIQSLEGKKVVDIAAGKDHYLCVTDQGEVFAWGNNEQRQCISFGGAEKQYFEPTRIEFFVQKKLKAVSCWSGLEALSSAVVTEDGALWMFGKDTLTRIRKVRRSNAYEPMTYTQISELEGKTVHVCLAKERVLIITQSVAADAEEAKQGDEAKEDTEGKKVVHLKPGECAKIDRDSQQDLVKELRVYAKNQRLFGNDEWTPIANSVHYRGRENSNAFVDNLEMMSGEVIELKQGKVAKEQHVELLQSRFVVLNGKQVLVEATAVDAALVQTFENVDEIKLKVPAAASDENSKCVSVYHQMKENEVFVLLKTFERK